MSDPKAEMKAGLLAKAEAAIDEVLVTRQPPGAATLADIEQSAWRVGQQLAQALTVELAAESAAAVGGGERAHGRARCASGREAGAARAGRWPQTRLARSADARRGAQGPGRHR